MKPMTLLTAGLLGSVALAGCGAPYHASSTATSRGVSTVSSPGHANRVPKAPSSSSAQKSVITPTRGPTSSVNPSSTFRKSLSGKTTSTSSRTSHTLAFGGDHVVRYMGSQVPLALPAGFHASSGQHLIFSTAAYRPVEGFRGTLAGHSFVLDFYQNSQPSSAGLYVGVQYNHHPVYFGYGPAAAFDVLAFNQDTVVLGNMDQGTYMVLNLITGQQNALASETAALNGYSAVTPPSHILGLPGTHYAVRIPYGNGNA